MCRAHCPISAAHSCAIASKMGSESRVLDYMISRGPFWPYYSVMAWKSAHWKTVQFYTLQRFILEAHCSLCSSDTPELLGLLNKHRFWLGASQKSFLPEHFTISYTQQCAVQHSLQCKMPCAIILFVLGEKHPDSNPLKGKWTVKNKKTKNNPLESAVSTKISMTKRKSMLEYCLASQILSQAKHCSAQFLRRLNKMLQFTPPN